MPGTFYGNQGFADAPKDKGDSDSEINLKRLMENVRWSRSKLRPWRKNRLFAIKQYVGKHYSDDGSKEVVPLNLIELAVDIFTSALVSGTPQVNVRTIYASLKPKAYVFQLGLNHLLDEIQLKATLTRAIREAIFSGMGIIKTGICIEAETEVQGIWHNAGQPFADAVSMDDWVHDMNATTWEGLQYLGNKYRLPLSWVKDNDFYENTDDLKATGRKDAMDQSNTGGVTSEISRPSGQQDEYIDHVDLLDLWLPLENKVITVPWAAQKAVILRKVDWEGPEGGPFIKLGFNEVLDNVIPLAPVAIWRDLHEIINKLYIKLGRQAQRQKTALIVRRGAEEDGSRIVDVEDGQAIAVDDPNATREASFGGPSPHNQAFVLNAKDLFSYMARNMNSVGGLERAAETVGQEEIVSRSASGGIASMQNEVHDFTGKVIYHVGWYLRSDPLREIPVVKRVQGTSIEIPAMLEPGDHEDDFFQYNIKLEPYSLHKNPPEVILAKIERFMQGIVMPMMPMMQQQGIAIDMEALLRLMGRYSDIGEELADILQYTEPLHEPPGPIGEERAKARQSPVTTRNYVRTNVPGSSQQGKDEALAKMLLGGAESTQDSELAGLVR